MYRLSRTFELPEETDTQSLAVVAKKRAGKSYLLAKLIELLYAAKRQVVLLDPKGDSWGLRSSADGKKPGLAIPIFGGEHGDRDITPNSGEYIGRLAAEERLSMIVDVSSFRKYELATFVAHFLETIYRVKNKEEFRTAMTLIVDEADAIAPQKPNKNVKDALRMHGALDDIVRRGGQRGIGCFVATQRPAVLSKDVLTQTQILVALRIIAPQDRKALEAWIDVHGTEEQQAALMGSLASLPVGTAWFWSPGWPTEAGIFQQTAIDPIWTYDSRDTPKAGQKRTPPKTLADIDLGTINAKLDAIGAEMADNNPKALNAEIKRLKLELAKKPASAPAKPGRPGKAPKPERVEIRTFDKLAMRELRKSVTVDVNVRMRSLRKHLAETLDQIVDDADLEIRTATANSLEVYEKKNATMAAMAEGAFAPSRPGGDMRTVHVAVGVGSIETGPVGNTRTFASHAELEAEHAATDTTVDDRAGMPKGDHAILTVCVQRGEKGDGATMKLLILITGYSLRSIQNYVSTLQAGGYIIRSPTGEFCDTAEGRRALGKYKPFPVGSALYSHLLATLSAGDAAVLRIYGAEPNALLRASDVAERTKYALRSAQNYVSSLHGRHAIVKIGNRYQLNPFLTT